MLGKRPENRWMLIILTLFFCVIYSQSFSESSARRVQKKMGQSWSGKSPIYIKLLKNDFNAELKHQKFVELALTAKNHSHV